MFGDMLRGLLIAGLAALAVAVPSAAAAGPGAPRILYLGDWSGHWALYAADPAGRTPPAQITFDDGVAAPVPSPDGRRIAFVTTSAPCRLAVAKPDGSGQRTVDRTSSSCTWPYDLSWSKDSTRLLYRFGYAIYVIGADGRHKRLIGTGTSPAWSPNGRSVAFLSSSTVFVSTQRKLVGVFSGAWEFAWSPNGKWIAAADPGFASHRPEVVLVRPDRRGVRKVSDDYGSTLAWSHDGRFLAFSHGDGLEVIDVARGGRRDLAAPYGSRYAWSPKGDLLAFDGSDGLELLDPANGTTRLVDSDHCWTPQWSPDARSIAYVVRLDLPDFHDGDLRISDLSGPVRTVVDASGVAGGQIDLSGWIRPRGRLHYRPPMSRSAATVSGQELVSPWKIERIATDGGRIAYVSCGHIFVWTPATGDVRQAEPAASLQPFCQHPSDIRAFEPFEIYDLALAGDRVAFGTRTGNSTQVFSARGLQREDHESGDRSAGSGRMSVSGARLVAGTTGSGRRRRRADRGLRRQPDVAARPNGRHDPVDPDIRGRSSAGGLRPRLGSSWRAASLRRSDRSVRSTGGPCRTSPAADRARALIRGHAPRRWCS
jgi:Tol biopolymer transport system component